MVASVTDSFVKDLKKDYVPGSDCQRQRVSLVALLYVQ